MNKYFIPTAKEEELIQIIQDSFRKEFTLIRLTQTMLNKSIIDANDLIRQIFRDENIIDYSTLKQGKIYYSESILFGKEPRLLKTSFYRPKSKNGDPRFWPHKLNSYLNEGDLIYITTYENKVLLIPLIEDINFKTNISNFLGDGQEDITVIKELMDKIRVVKNLGWIKSVSPLKLNPKDVGDTLEIALGLSINNIAAADFKGEIEIKAKRSSSRTKDTLFSKVPDWNLSKIPSAADMMLTYGYVSTKHPGFMDLYVTVSNIPNNQGLVLSPNDNELVLEQLYKNGKIEVETCKWKYATLKQKLYEKHPKTVWVVADHKKINNEFYFKYDTVELTQKPIFTQFLSLISQGIVTFDWRGKVMPDKTLYRDHGHCFRLVPSKRNLLFGSLKKIKF